LTTAGLRQIFVCGQEYESNQEKTADETNTNQPREVIMSENSNSNKDSTFGGSLPNVSTSIENPSAIVGGQFGVNYPSYGDVFGISTNPTTGGMFGVNYLSHTGLPGANSHPSTGGLFNTNTDTLSMGNSGRYNAPPFETISPINSGLVGPPPNANSNSGTPFRGNPDHAWYANRALFAGNSSNGIGTPFRSSPSSNSGNLFRSNSLTSIENPFRGNAPLCNTSIFGSSATSNNGTLSGTTPSSNSGTWRYPEVSLFHGIASANTDASIIPEFIASNSTQPWRIQLPYAGGVLRPNWSVPNICNRSSFLGNSNGNNGFGESPSSGSTSGGPPDRNIPADEAIWRKWAAIAGIPIELIVEEFNRAYSCHDKSVFVFFRQELRVVFLTAGASDADASIARESFCFWALEKYVAQRLAPVST
jgi:hypothetical protein